MNARRAVARATAVVASTVVVASGLVTTAWAGAASVDSGSPTANTGSRTVVFNVASTFLPSPATVSVQLQRQGTSASQDQIAASGTYSGGKVTATINFTAANPGRYDAGLSQGPISDSCASCVQVIGATATASSVSPSRFGQGTTGDGYQDFVINGANFTKGLYTECEQADIASCPGDGPWVRVLRDGVFDGNVDLTQTTPSATDPTPTTIKLRINVTGSDNVAYTDDVQVIPSDRNAGKIATCADCLTITPGPSVDTVSLIPTNFPDATPLSNQIGQNATGQTLVLTGDTFASDATVSFVKPNGAGQSENITSGTPVVDTVNDKITVPNVNTTNVATTGAWGISVVNTGDHSSSPPATLTVNPKPVGTGVDYVDTAGTAYGQGAKGVKLDVTVDPEASPFFPGSGLLPSSTPHTLVRFGLNGVNYTAQAATLGGGGADNNVRATFELPENAATGDYSVTVVNPDGGTSAPCDDSTLIFPNTCVLSIVTGPKIGSMSPNTLAPGATNVPVTISGSGFHPGNVAVQIGSADGPVTVSNVSAPNSTTVTAQVSVADGTNPADFDVVVTNTDDKGAGTYPDLFHVTNFTVSGADPDAEDNSGPVAVTISGTNLDPNSTVSLVKTGVDPIVGTTNNSSSTDSATALHRTFQLLNKGPGDYDVQVTAPGNGGTGTCNECFTVVAAGAPTLSSVSPNTVGGGATNVTLTLTGTRIYPGATVVFSSADVHPIGAADVTAPNSLTQHISVDSDATPGTTTVKIENSDGQQSGPQNLTITAAPTVTGIDPNRRAAGSSFELTVTGTNFQDGATVDFSNNAISADVTNVTPTEITATVTVPRSVTSGGASVAVHVVVINPDKGRATSPEDLTIDPAPSIDSLDPASAARNRTFTLHVLGDNFAEGAGLTSVDGELAVSNVNVVNEHEITATLSTNGASAGSHALKVDNHDGGTATKSLVVFTKPGAPRNLVAKSRDKALAVSWLPPSNNGGDPVTSYTATLTRHRTGATVARYTTPTPSTLSHRFGKLTNGVRYDVKVVATNDAGSGPAATTSARPKYATTLSIKRSDKSVPAGSKVTLSGRLLRANGTPLGNRKIAVFRTAFTVTKKLATVTTNAKGKWTLTFRPKRTAKYFASFAGNRLNRAATSATVRITVQR
jgi:hypothetical protein